MFSLLSDLEIALKIVGFLILFRWVGNNIQNRLLGAIILVVAAYYFLWLQWDIFSLFVVVFIIVAMTGVGYLVQDLVFQYGSVTEREAEERALMQRMYLRR